MALEALHTLLVHHCAGVVGIGLVGPGPGTLFHRYDVALGPCLQKISFYSFDVKLVVCSAQALSRQTLRAELLGDGTGDGDLSGLIWGCMLSIAAVVVYAGMLVNDLGLVLQLVANA